jgi:hypothetical protein
MRIWKTIRRRFVLAALAAGCLWVRPSEAGARTEDYSRKAEQAYGLVALEQLDSRGLEVRRVLLIDSHLNDLGALSFTRRPGHVPQVSFRTAGRPQPQLRAALPAALWKEIIERSATIDDAASISADDSICLDSWTFVVEAAPAADGGDKERIERRVVDMCPRPDYVLWLAEVAVEALPPCRRLDPGLGDAIARLTTCSALYGHRPSAAEVAGPLAQFAGFEAAGARSVDHFASNAVVDWQGRLASGPTAGAAWQRDFAGLPEADLHIERIVGIDPLRVAVRGSILYRTHARPADTQGSLFRAPVAMTWVKEAGNRFRIKRIRVGPFTRL